MRPLGASEREEAALNERSYRAWWIGEPVALSAHSYRGGWRLARCKRSIPPASSCKGGEPMDQTGR